MYLSFQVCAICEWLGASQSTFSHRSNVNRDLCRISCNRSSFRLFLLSSCSSSFQPLHFKLSQQRGISWTWACCSSYILGSCNTTSFQSPIYEISCQLNLRSCLLLTIFDCVVSIHFDLLTPQVVKLRTRFSNELLLHFLQSSDPTTISTRKQWPQVATGLSSVKLLQSKVFLLQQILLHTTILHYMKQKRSQHQSDPLITAYLVKLLTSIGHIRSLVSIRRVAASCLAEDHRIT